MGKKNKSKLKLDPKLRFEKFKSMVNSGVLVATERNCNINLDCKTSWYIEAQRAPYAVNPP